MASTSPLGSQIFGLASIMRRAFAGDCLSGLASQLSDRLAGDAGDAAAILDMSTILQIRGQDDLAMQLQEQALSMRQHYALSSNPVRPTLRVLAIMGPGPIMANTPIEFLIEQTSIALEMLYLGPGLPVPAHIPHHDVAFVAVCESDAHQRLLSQLAQVMEHWPRPYLNAPGAIARLGRDRVPMLLQHVKGLVASQSERIARAELQELTQLPSAPCDLFPVIVRPVDSHAGHGLTRLEDADQIGAYLREQPEDQFFMAPFIDYRSEDGKYRKYRIVVVDGQPMAAHMAVSTRWMVHYLNADMLDNPNHRDEEARFMQTFDDEFLRRHRHALSRIDQRIGLDYYSIDCAEARSGELVVFEIDSGAVVHAMDPVDLFPYKAPQMQKVFAAFGRLLERRTAVRQAA